MEYNETLINPELIGLVVICSISIIAGLFIKKFITKVDEMTEIIEDLENNLKNYKIEKFRCYDNIIDLYGRNEQLQNTIDTSNMQIETLISSNERLRSLRKVH